MNAYDHLDRSRRRRPAWLRRGIVFAAIAQRGDEVDEDAFEESSRLLSYRDARAVNRFFYGKPEPGLERRAAGFASLSVAEAPRPSLQTGGCRGCARVRLRGRASRLNVSSNEADGTYLQDR